MAVPTVFDTIISHNLIFTLSHDRTTYTNSLFTQYRKETEASGDDDSESEEENKQVEEVKATEEEKKPKQDTEKEKKQREIIMR